MKVVISIDRIDRILLAIYLVSLFVLLTFPIAGPGFRFLGIQSDKWMHILLFGGLAVLLRWNLSRSHHALVYSVCTAFIVAAATEVAQGLVAYRSAEVLDLLAGLLGSILGAISVHQLLLSPLLQQWFGLLVSTLGLMIAAFFLLADVIGVGDARHFGAVQVAGMALGALISAGGVKVYLAGKKWLDQPR